MEKWSVLSVSKRLLYPYKHAAIKMASRYLPPKKQLLFVFGGRTHHWPGMGRDLYATQPVFRETILECDAIFQELSGISILPNFQHEEGNNDSGDEQFIIFTLSAIQMAFSRLLKNKGILPDAILGISLGEITGIYAAGGLTLRDAIKLVIESSMITRLEKNTFVPLYLQSTFSEARKVCSNSPQMLLPIYEAGKHAALVLCKKENKEAIGNFLQENGINWSCPHNELTWPYHTRILRERCENLIHYSREVQALPLNCDYFSCVRGERIPSMSIIDNSYWFQMTHNPVLLHSALEEMNGIINAPVIVNIGHHALQKGQVIRSIGDKEIELLETLSMDGNETSHLEKTIRKLSKFNGRKLNGERSDPLKHFISRLKLNDPLIQNDPHGYINFLKRYADIHFLPSQNAWLVLDFDQVEHILKNPQLFSSSLHKSFDECLVGSDPPEHTLLRSLLQPLFSQQILTALGEFSTEYASNLLEKLDTRKEFNFVESFSLPLAEAVVNKLLGLSETDQAELRASIRHHVYSMAHLESLHSYFTKYLERGDHAAGSAATLVLSFVENNTISFDAAVKLMRLLWIAGMTTTSMLLSTSAYMILKVRSLIDRIRENEQLINKLIEECLRLESPEVELYRVTTTDVQLGPVKIPGGSRIILNLSAANRDPKYFENPNEISLDRVSKKHLAFGGGYHYCLGVGLARLEAKHAMKSLLARIDGLRLREIAPIKYFPSSHFRGLAELNVIQEKN